MRRDLTSIVLALSVNARPVRKRMPMHTAFEGGASSTNGARKSSSTATKRHTMNPRPIALTSTVDQFMPSTSAQASSSSIAARAHVQVQ